MMAKKTIICCNYPRTGKFCSECGRSLVPKELKLQQKIDKLQGQLKTAQNRVYWLRAGILWYVEAHHKKMAGSTIQYSIADLEKLLEPFPVGNLPYNTLCILLRNLLDEKNWNKKGQWMGKRHLRDWAEEIAKQIGMEK